jgi:hypothetical protein
MLINHHNVHVNGEAHNYPPNLYPTNPLNSTTLLHGTIRKSCTVATMVQFGTIRKSCTVATMVQFTLYRGSIPPPLTQSSQVPSSLPGRVKNSTNFVYDTKWTLFGGNHDQHANPPTVPISCSNCAHNTLSAQSTAPLRKIGQEILSRPLIDLEVW